MSEPLILVVDDEPELRFLIERRLQAHRYRVLTAENGKEGLEKIKLHKPQLVLLDLIMPEKTGEEVLEEIRSSHELLSTLVIIFTAKGKEDDLKRVLQKGANLAMTKPFDAALLVDKIKGLLHC